MNKWAIVEDKIFDAETKDGDYQLLIAQVPNSVNRKLFLQAREMKAILLRIQGILQHQYPTQEHMDLMGLSADDPLRAEEKAHQKSVLQLLSDINSTLASTR